METILRIDSTQLLCKVSKRDNVVHMLDLDKGMTLTNALDGGFCAKVMSQMSLSGSLSSYRFMAYHTDNDITEFDLRSGSFDFVSTNDNRVDKEFAKEMFYMYG